VQNPTYSKYINIINVSLHQPTNHQSSKSFIFEKKMCQIDIHVILKMQLKSKACMICCNPRSNIYGCCHWWSGLQPAKNFGVGQKSLLATIMTSSMCSQPWCDLFAMISLPTVVNLFQSGVTSARQKNYGIFH